MIKSRRDLKEYLEYEKELYPNTLYDYIVCYQRVYNWRFIKWLRRAEYHKNTAGILHKLLYLFCARQKNRIGRIISVEIWENSFGKGLVLHHNGNIVINGGAKIGSNCQLHGDNCIGNSKVESGMPVLGDNVDIGVGAKILGDVTIANGIVIGANAVVTKSFLEENITIAGVPARRIK